jgi:hypothetical protein
VVDAAPRLVRKDFYEVAEISLDLKGEARDADDAIAEMLKGEPITVAEDLRQDAGHTKVRLLRYAVPIEQKPGRFQPCELTPSRVWFPGLKATIASRRAEAEETCKAVASMSEFVEQVNQFHVLRENLELLTIIAAELSPGYLELVEDEDESGLPKSIDGAVELVELE